MECVHNKMEWNETNLTVVVTFRRFYNPTVTSKIN